MKTLDEKAAEYSARLSNQSGNYTKGEIETAYVSGAIEGEVLSRGETGTFEQAIVSLKRGFNITRKGWGGQCFITRNVDTDISSDAVPEMRSLSDAAKAEISKRTEGSIHYRDQCLFIYFGEEIGCVAAAYTPSWQDMFSNDWVIFE